MEHLLTHQAMTAWAIDQKAQGMSIGFVPTMGFLHAGHASLMAKLRPMVDKLVVSVYVNPLQFGPNEDLDRYPRNPEGDAAICMEQGVDALFMPPDLYPDGFSTSVSVHGLTEGLCGGKRPGHFDGVATVVTRLFGLTRCDMACFGEKDWQQLMVIRRFTKDLALPVRIVPGELIRAEDGLARSSRNTYLTPAIRKRALTLNKALFAMAEEVKAGERNVATLTQQAIASIDCTKLDYLQVVDAESLLPLTTIDRPARALVAAFYEDDNGRTTRLIDNVGVGPELTWA